jgi:hypothetical protein
MWQPISAALLPKQEKRKEREDNRKSLRSTKTSRRAPKQDMP